MLSKWKKNDRSILNKEASIESTKDQIQEKKK